ncbi:MAG: sigma-54 dependent transcriptional regulator [Bacteroidota bacterium]|nr:sigma-54 dependent transcriptional regulator [Bacteroidota bacterium]
MADRILIVDDEKILRESISFILEKEGYTVAVASDGSEAYQKLLDDTFDLIITDIEMPQMKGIELLDKAIHLSPQTYLMVITAYGSIETAISALRKGASDYILKPIDFDDLIFRIRRLLDVKKLTLENQILRRELHQEINFSNIIGKSPAIQKIFQTISMVASTESTVIITGKSGTGKELVARALHYNSSRSDKPLIIVNCGAISESLIESELFGHKKGSFTGAVADKIGYFKAADGGTLYLDEISEMPLNLQVKILRAIEQKEFTPVGMSTPINVDVRIVASTNRDLKMEVEAGRFRMDLFYRLNVVEIHLPSLSDRREDIPLLVEHFIEKYSNKNHKHISGASNEVMRSLTNHNWKGEIRELENVIERAVIFCKDNFITMDDLPDVFKDNITLQLTEDSQSLDEMMKGLERHYIESSLRGNNNDKEKTARELKISLPTLYRRLKELNITQSR